ncbi:prostaglandin reductase 1-like [Babylonia areolata]|uniref:prostaglandin reductase 1-like n=1 Tax=Babylonia areolata TaxID=304850 RepID=UPI003FD2ECB7
MSQTAKKWTRAKDFVGVPKVDDFKLDEETVSLSLKPGEVVTEALYLTVDPYMRGMPFNIGDTMFGEQVARVKVSNNPDFPEGCLVVAPVGWRTLTLVSNPQKPSIFGPLLRRIPDMGDLSPSLALGCLGMPGLTAYFGLLDRGQPKAGEVVLVSAAAGAVGSVVGQIAKIKGCTVIGSAGTKEKCDWVKSLGFDHVFNYKETSVDEALKEFAPNGIDLHFDNVGGDFSYAVLQNHLKTCGRVVMCGAISMYNSTDKLERSAYRFIIYKQLDILGVIVSQYKDRFSEGLEQLLQWVKEGKIKYRETVTEGFERMPEAFISLFQGANIGKAVVKA